MTRAAAAAATEIVMMYNEPPQPLELPQDQWPTLKLPPGLPGRDVIARAYRMALENLLVHNTVRDATCQQNRSGLFRDPPGTFIRAGGDYQSPWTRDAAINAWAAGSLLIPEVALNTLWAVTERRDDGRLVVQQDKEWWDQVIWVHAMWNHYLVTGNRDLLGPAYEAATTTLAIREALNRDEATGLMRGPACLADGIAGYPPPLGDHNVAGESHVLKYRHLDAIQVLSTNCVYVAAYRGAAGLASALERTADAAVWSGKADALAAAINAHLWDERRGTYAYYRNGPGPLEGKLEPYQEGLGIAYAVLFGIASDARAKRVVAAVHREPWGVPCVWPHFPAFDDARPGRHNNVVWPLVSGMWSRALARVGDADRLGIEIQAQAELAVAGDDFREIYHPATGQPHGGWQAGQPWQSCVRQTWSATAFLQSVHLAVLGLRFEPDGIRLAPCVPKGWDGASLRHLPYRGSTLTLNLRSRGARAISMTLDERDATGQRASRRSPAGGNDLHQ